MAPPHTTWRGLPRWAFRCATKPASRVNCIIPTLTGKISNLCFGGEKFDTLFATCGNTVFKRKLKIRGANAFQPPVKPAPRL